MSRNMRYCYEATEWEHSHGIPGKNVGLWKTNKQFPDRNSKICP